MDENEFFFSNNIIKLNKPNDIAFSNIAQNACVTGATLPSGFKVPESGQWIINSNFLVNTDEVVTKSKVKPE
tara:strand:+ start:571 stop:786 length:216 start_codon:yes stop_codon:yes gene_type:complete